jgi:hypothetical protein
MIGITTMNVNQMINDNHKKDGYFYDSRDGALFSGPPFNYNNHTSHLSKLIKYSINIGDIIDVELNFYNKTLSIKIVWFRNT